MTKLHIIDRETGEVVNSIDCRNDTSSGVRRVLRGLSINFNFQDYRIDLSELEALEREEEETRLLRPKTVHEEAEETVRCLGMRP